LTAPVVLPPNSAADPASRLTERVTGAVMIAYAVAVAVHVTTRTASTVPGVPFPQYLEIVASNYQLYVISTAASLLSSILLIVLATGLWPTLRSYNPYPVLVSSFLFLAAAVTWSVSASAGLGLAALARDFVAASGVSADIAAGSAQAMEFIRETTGRTGFTLAALGLMTLAGLIAMKGPLPRWLGWLGLLVGASMLLIWLDDAPVLHRVGGSGYLAWLVIAGGWLVARGARPAQPPAVS
jgi:hypothetical protein